jgi:molecular chaperone DnaK
VKDIVLLDVLPLSLGLRKLAADCSLKLSNVIRRYHSQQFEFHHVVDNQSSVEIHVLQGERDVSSGNRSLGKFELVGIPPAPRGVPQIEVSFEVDATESYPCRLLTKRQAASSRCASLPRRAVG